MNDSRVQSHISFFAGVVFMMYCPALVNKSTAGQGTLILISRNIIHGTKAAALVTKSFFNQDKGLISFLLKVRQISCNIQSLPVSTDQADAFLLLGLS